MVGFRSHWIVEFPLGDDLKSCWSTFSRLLVFLYEQALPVLCRQCSVCQRRLPFALHLRVNEYSALFNSEL